MTDERESDADFADKAADATEETRRRAGDEGRTLEEQADPLSVEEDEGEVSAY